MSITTAVVVFIIHHPAALTVVLTVVLIVALTIALTIAQIESFSAGRTPCRTHACRILRTTPSFLWLRPPLIIYIYSSAALPNLVGDVLGSRPLTRSFISCLPLGSAVSSRSRRAHGRGIAESPRPYAKKRLLEKRRLVRFVAHSRGASIAHAAFRKQRRRL